MSGPYLTSDRGSYRLEWPDPERAILEFDLIRTGRDGDVTAEVTATSTGPNGGTVAVNRLNLLASRSRAEFANHLGKRTAGSSTDWPTILEIACREVVVAFRAGQPAVLLRDAVQPEDAGHILPPLLVGRMPTIWYGDGGSAKSYLSLAAALTIHTGEPLLGLHPTARRRVGILDYEMDAWEHRQRMDALLAGRESPDIVYVPCSRPLADDVDRLRRIIRDRDIGYIVVDSIALACDGPPEAAEVAGRFFGGLRELALGSLLIAHVNRAGDTDRPFGSAFWHNGARLTWYVKREPSVGPGSVTVGLFNKKANTGPIAPPVGFRIAFGAGETTIERTDARDVEDFAAHVPVKYRVQAEVAAGAKTIAEIAAAIDAAPDTVKKAVDRDLRGERPTFTRVLGPDSVYRIGLAA